MSSECTFLTNSAFSPKLRQVFQTVKDLLFHKANVNDVKKAKQATNNNNQNVKQKECKCFQSLTPVTGKQSVIKGQI